VPTRATKLGVAEKRLGDVIVRSQFQADDPVDFVVSGRDEQNGGCRLPPARSRRQTSMPSKPGKPMSSTIASGRSKTQPGL